MSGSSIAACPRCGNPVSVMPTSGGRGSGDTTAYEAVCNARCGYRSLELPSNCSGRRSDAFREHNRIAKAWPATPAVRKQKELPVMSNTHPVPAPHPMPVPAPHPMRMASRDMHPTRMATLADALASKPGASEDVRVLASIVRELCYQVDRAKGEAMSARNAARRGY